MIIHNLELFQSGEERQGGTANPGQRRKLPIRLSAINLQFERRWTRYPHWWRKVKLNRVMEKGYRGSVEDLERFCAIDELVELWDIEYEGHEEPYSEVVEQRGIDSGQEVLQVIVGTPELQRDESRKNTARERRRM